MREVVWSTSASRQYLEALRFLAERNEPAAAKLATRIRETLQALAVRPIGRPGRMVGTFEKIVLRTSYLVVYKLVGDELRIVRLLHMSQDWRAAEEPDEDA